MDIDHHLYEFGSVEYHVQVKPFGKLLTLINPVLYGLTNFSIIIIYHLSCKSNKSEIMDNRDLGNVCHHLGTISKYWHVGSEFLTFLCMAVFCNWSTWDLLINSNPTTVSRSSTITWPVTLHHRDDKGNLFWCFGDCWTCKRGISAHSKTRPC